MNKSIAQLWDELEANTNSLYVLPEAQEEVFLLRERQEIITVLSKEIDAKKNITDAEAEQWMHLAIVNSSSNIFEMLAEKKPSLLQKLYSHNRGEAYTWAEWTLHVRGELTKEYHKDQACLQGMRSENKLLQKYLRSKKVHIRDVFLQEMVKAGLNPNEGVENPFLLKSVADSYVKLLHRYEYLREGKHKPAAKKLRLFNNEYRRSLEAFANQLGDSGYVKKQGWDASQAKHAHSILKAVLTGKKYIKEDKAHNADVRTKRVALYRAFQFDATDKSFSLKDLMVVVWRALNDEKVITDPERRKLLRMAFMQQMYEADALAHEAGANNIPGLENTSFGCAKAVVYGVSVLNGVHPDVQIQYLNADTVASKAMTVMSCWIVNHWKEHPNLRAQVKTWVAEGGMNESLLKDPIDFVEYLMPQLEKEYEEFGEEGRECIREAMDNLQHRNLPPVLLTKLFKDFAETFLNKKFTDLNLIKRSMVERIVKEKGFLQSEILLNEWNVFLEQSFFGDFLGGTDYVKAKKSEYLPDLNKILQDYLGDKQYLLSVLQTTAQAADAVPVVMAMTPFDDDQEDCFAKFESPLPVLRKE